MRWFIENRRLSREQTRAIEAAVSRGEAVSISAMTLLEVGMLASAGQVDLGRSLAQFLEEVAGHPAIQLLPITYEVVSEAAALRSLRDPGDRAIVATARVHRLRLVTSDQRIIDSNLVAVVE